VPVVQIGDADVSCADDGRRCVGDLDSIGDVGGAEGRRLARCLEASAARMSKKTKKKKAKMRRSKANHGKRPNMGRG
jgi:hypothetical protein